MRRSTGSGYVPAAAEATLRARAFAGNRDNPERGALTRMVTDPGGMFGIPPGQAAGAVTAGGPAAVADHLARLAEHGAQRTIVTFVAGGWSRQAELLAEARSRLA